MDNTERIIKINESLKKLPRNTLTENSELVEFAGLLQGARNLVTAGALKLGAAGLRQSSLPAASPIASTETPPTPTGRVELPTSSSTVRSVADAPVTSSRVAAVSYNPENQSSQTGNVTINQRGFLPTQTIGVRNRRSNTIYGNERSPINSPARVNPETGGIVPNSSDPAPQSASPGFNPEETPRPIPTGFNPEETPRPPSQPSAPQTAAQRIGSGVGRGVAGLLNLGQRAATSLGQRATSAAGQFSSSVAQSYREARPSAPGTPGTSTPGAAASTDDTSSTPSASAPQSAPGGNTQQQGANMNGFRRAGQIARNVLGYVKANPGKVAGLAGLTLLTGSTIPAALAIGGMAAWKQFNKNRQAAEGRPTPPPPPPTGTTTESFDVSNRIKLISESLSKLNLNEYAGNRPRPQNPQRVQPNPRQRQPLPPPNTGGRLGNAASTLYNAQIISGAFEAGRQRQLGQAGAGEAHSDQLDSTKFKG